MLSLGLEMGRVENADGLVERVTAFRDKMAQPAVFYQLQDGGYTINFKRNLGPATDARHFRLHVHANGIGPCGDDQGQQRHILQTDGERGGSSMSPGGLA